MIMRKTVTLKKRLIPLTMFRLSESECNEWPEARKKFTNDTGKEIP